MRSLSVSFSQCFSLLLQELLDKCESVASMANLVFRLCSELSKSLFIAVRLEDWVPSKHVLSPWFDNLAIAAPRENHRLSTRSLTEGKDALSVRSLVIKVLNHLPETLSTHASQEILDVRAW